MTSIHLAIDLWAIGLLSKTCWFIFNLMAVGFIYWCRFSCNRAGLAVNQVGLFFHYRLSNVIVLMVVDYAVLAVVIWFYSLAAIPPFAFYPLLSF